MDGSWDTGSWWPTLACYQAKTATGGAGTAQKGAITPMKLTDEICNVKSNSRMVAAKWSWNEGGRSGKKREQTRGDGNSRGEKGGRIKHVVIETREI